VTKISHVLLPDGWHTVAQHSFVTDAYEYVQVSGSSTQVVVAGSARRDSISSKQARRTTPVWTAR
jgi:hypothetical protein